MLAKSHWENCRPRTPTLSVLATQKRSHERAVVDKEIEPFLSDLGVPQWDGPALANTVNLHDIYCVRRHIMHGDPRMEADTIKMFGPYVQNRRNALSGIDPSKHGLPDPTSFGCCL